MSGGRHGAVDFSETLDNRPPFPITSKLSDVLGWTEFRQQFQQSLWNRSPISRYPSVAQSFQTDRIALVGSNALAKSFEKTVFFSFLCQSI